MAHIQKMRDEGRKKFIGIGDDVSLRKVNFMLLNDATSCLQ